MVRAIKIFLLQRLCGAPSDAQSLTLNTQAGEYLAWF